MTGIRTPAAGSPADRYPTDGSAADDAPAHGSLVDHLLFETQAGAASQRFLADAVELARSGHRVWAFLVSDGVAAGIRGASAELAELVRAGGRVWIDDFTLDQRALAKAPLEPGAVIVGMDEVAELLTGSRIRAVWH